ncbi:MAG: NADH-quinone oxidoreductase subunit J, partial [Armatimonadota bacterium]
MESLIFYITAVAMVAAAAAAMLQRSAVHTVLLLVLTFCGFAVLFLLCGAEVVAVLQIIVYAGAIMAVYMFVIFYVGSAGGDPPWRRWRQAPIPFAAGLVGVLGLLGCIAHVIRQAYLATPLGSHGGAKQFGAALFSLKYALPVEIAS